MNTPKFTDASGLLRKPMPPKWLALGYRYTAALRIVVYSIKLEVSMSRKNTAKSGAPAPRGGMAQAVLFAVGIALVPGLAAAQDATTSIKRDSDAAKAQAMAEPSYQTREERLRAQPLDWNTTIGKPKPRVLTAAEKKAQLRAKPEAVDGGRPDPKANEEARRLYPEDWKAIDQMQR